MPGRIPLVSCQRSTVSMTLQEQSRSAIPGLGFFSEMSPVFVFHVVIPLTQCFPEFPILLPRQVSSACCCILTRRASEGSASEPALARRKICEI